MTATPLTDPIHSYLAERLAALPEVRLAYLFGSRARGTHRPDSDFDIAVLVEHNEVADAAGVNRMIRRLAGRLGGDVPAHMLHIVLLNGAPPLLRHRVLRDGVLLRQRSKAERVRFAIRTIREYHDMEPRLREHTRARLARLRRRQAGEAGGAARGAENDGGPGDILASARRVGRLLGEGRALR